MTIQDRVQQDLDDAISRDLEGPIQVAAYLRGELIVDAWAAPAGLRLHGDSLLPMYSTGKGVLATAVHQLIERGLLDISAPIAHYWPEFAANGKGDIRLWHVLHHVSGMALMPLRAAGIAAGDWDGMCAFLAADTPNAAPATLRQYHAITLAWLLGEPARRVDGRPIAAIIRDEVLSPLGVADGMYFGLPDSALPRCIDAMAPKPDPHAAPPPAPPLPPASEAPEPPRGIIPAYVLPLEDWINRRDMRRACIPASNGYGCARALARHYAALLGPGVDGVRLLRPATLARATSWPAAGDTIAGDGNWALGYLLQLGDRSGRYFGHNGHGGAIGFADREAQLTVAILKARSGGPVPGEILATIRAAVGAV